jgi:hypothetical protein
MYIHLQAISLVTKNLTHFVVETTNSYRVQVYGCSGHNDWGTAAYPSVADAIASARSNNTSESWKFVQHEIYRVVRAITQTASVLSGSLT